MTVDKRFLVLDKRIRAFVGLGIALMISVFIMSSSVLAGGWAVVTLDELPTSVPAGETIALSLTVRQHGQRPTYVTELTVTFTDSQSGETISVVAEPLDEEIRYVAEVSLPAAGNWQITVDANPFGVSDLGTLEVVEPVLAEAGGSGSLLTVGGAVGRWLAVCVLGVGVVLAVWTRRRFAYLLTTLGIIALTLAVSTSLLRPSVAQEEKMETDRSVLVEHGRNLFFAKGCVSCHLHEEAKGEWSTQAGPDLTVYKASEEFLVMWLADPLAVKPNTLMPNLQLDDGEIEALVAFLTE